MCVGWAQYEHGQLTRYGRYILPDTDHGQRLWEFGQWLDEAMLAVDTVVFELPYAGRQRHAYGVLMMYVGVLLSRYAQRFQQELPAENRVPSHVVKRALGLKRLTTHAERKRQMVRAMNERFGLKLKYKANDRHKQVSEDDTADAIALGLVWHDRG